MRGIQRPAKADNGVLERVVDWPRFGQLRLGRVGDEWVRLSWGSLNR